MAKRRWTRAWAGEAFVSGMERLNARHPWSHNDAFHPWILANLPQQRRAALDVGCGRGALVAALSPHFEAVWGSDRDDEMRQAAARHCAGLPNVTIATGPWTELPGPFDVITMVAVLHHLDVPEGLEHVREMLAPGGRFLAVGLAPPSSASDHAWEIASIATNPVIGFIKHPRPHLGPPLPPSCPISEPTMPFDELREHVVEVMPGAAMKHRLGFRHTIAWSKPG